MKLVCQPTSLADRQAVSQAPPNLVRDAIYSTTEQRSLLTENEPHSLATQMTFEALASKEYKEEASYIGGLSHK